MRGRESASVVDLLQFVNRRQPPAGVSSQTQILAVLHRIAPCDVCAIVLRSPHEACRRIAPITMRLFLLCWALSPHKRYSSADDSDKEEKKDDLLHCVLQSAKSCFRERSP